MGPIRQSLAVVTIGAVKPESKKQRPPQRAGRTGAPAGELRQPRGPPITCGLASSNWPPGPSKRRGACEPK